MIKYNVGDLIQCPSGDWFVIETHNEDALPWKHKYKVISQLGETKQVSLFELTHRCI